MATNRIRVRFDSDFDDGPIQFTKGQILSMDESYARGLPREVVTLLGTLSGDELKFQVPVSGSGMQVTTSTLRQAVKYKAAQARGNSNPPRLANIGDSTSILASGTGIYGAVNAVKNNFTAKLAAANGWQFQALVGDQNAYNGHTPSYNPDTLDSRVAIGGWASANSPTMLGGSPLQCSGASSSDLVFTFSEPVDKVVFGYPIANVFGVGGLIVKIDGATVDTLNQNGSAGYQFKTYSVPLGMHTVSIQATGTGIRQWNILEGYSSTSGKARVLLCGVSGGNISYHATNANPYDPLPSLVAYAPDFTIINSTINESTGAMAESTYAANLDVICNALGSTSDILWCVGYSANNANVTGGLYDAYKRAALRAMADFPTLSVCDFREVSGSSFAVASRRGYALTTGGADNNVHPIVGWHTDVSTYLSGVMTAMGVS
jgi:hypothetical protein